MRAKNTSASIEFKWGAPIFFDKKSEPGSPVRFHVQGVCNFLFVFGDHFHHFVSFAREAV
jgi:hypothetical protein